MASKLSDLLARASFPLFGMHARDWEGPAFVGEVAREGDNLSSVALVYLDAIDGSTMGAAVSNIEAGWLTGADPVEAHAVNFIARFEPQYLVKRVKRRRFRPFLPGDLAERGVTATVAGETMGAAFLTHRTLPLQLLRVAKRRGRAITDVGIVTWRLSALELALKVAPVDASFAREFDAPREEQYPPPEWLG